MTTKSRARKTKTEPNAALNLLAALKFISLAQRKEGTAYQTCCRIENGYITAYDGKLAAGCKIEEDLNAAPHTLQLVAALSRCKSELAVTQLDLGRLSLKSGPFRALVNCAEPTELFSVDPDPAQYPLNPLVLESLRAVLPLADHNDPWANSVLLKNGSATASNGYVLFEHWHGCDLPAMSIPAEAAEAWCKAGKIPSKFGYGGKTFTVWFEDGSWIKTNLIAEEWPDLSELLNVPVNPWPVAPAFFEALEAVESMAREDTVYFLDGALCSEANAEIGTSYAIEGLPVGIAFSIKALKIIKGVATRIDFEQADKALFFGENMRGCIMQKVVEFHRNNDDDLPF